MKIFFLGVQDQWNHLREGSMNPDCLNNGPLFVDGSSLADTFIYSYLGTWVSGNALVIAADLQFLSWVEMRVSSICELRVVFMDLMFLLNQVESLMQKSKF